MSGKEANAKGWVGVDVSKAELCVSIGAEHKPQHFERSDSGYRELMASLPPAAHVVVEASGGYERGLVRALQHGAVTVSVVNPKRVRDFARSFGELAKTDPIDADMIREFGVRMQPRTTELSNSRQIKLQSLRSRYEQLVSMRVAEKNRRDHHEGEMLACVDEHIDFLTGRIEAICAAMDEIIEGEEQLARTSRSLESVPGVGRKTLVCLLVYLPELGRLDNKAVAALAGLAPYPRDSGAFRGRRSIRGGRHEVRKALYMAAVAGLRCNTALKQTYDRLRAAGKTAKVALTACMRKLLVWLNAMARANQSWDPSLASS
jgi:transposase